MVGKRPLMGVYCFKGIFSKRREAPHLMPPCPRFRFVVEETFCRYALLWLRVQLLAVCLPIGQYQVVSGFNALAEPGANDRRCLHLPPNTVPSSPFQILLFTIGEQSLPFVLPHKRVSSRRCISRRRGTPFEGGLVLVGNESIFSTLSRDTTRTVPTTLPWGWYFVLSLIA